MSETSGQAAATAPTAKEGFCLNLSGKDEGHSCMPETSGQAAATAPTASKPASKGRRLAATLGLPK